MFSIESVVWMVLYLIVAGTIFGLLNWLIDAWQLAEPWNKFAKRFLVTAAVLVLIGLLLSFVGHPIVRW